MATTDPKSPPGGDATRNPKVASLQKRAEAMAGARGKSVSPSTFVQEAWVELKKTTWPTREVLTKSVTVVLALVVGVAVWVGFVDVLGRQVLDHLLFNKP